MDEDDGSHPELSEDSPHSNNAELVFESNVSSLAWILNYVPTKLHPVGMILECST